MKSTIVTLFATFFAMYGLGQNKDLTEAEKIDTTIQAVMHCISVKRGEEVNWSRFRNLFLPTARFNFFGLDKGNNHIFINKSLEEFVAEAQYGKYEFNEVQLGVNISVYGSIAHAFQGYHFKINGGEVERRGINSIQLVYVENRWWIANMSWQPETESLDYPASLRDLVSFD